MMRVVHQLKADNQGVEVGEKSRGKDLDTDTSIIVHLTRKSKSKSIQNSSRGEK
jgi:hypothetical protein